MIGCNSTCACIVSRLEEKERECEHIKITLQKIPGAPQ